MQAFSQAYATIQLHHAHECTAREACKVLIADTQ